MSSRFNRVKDICEEFFSLEDHHGLLDLQIDGVKLWQALRMEVYYTVATGTNVLEHPHPFKKDLLAQLKHKKNQLYCALFDSPLRDISPVDYILFPHDRLMNKGGEQIEIYTEALSDEIKAAHKSCLIFKRLFKGSGTTVKQDNARHLEQIAFLSSLDSFFNFTKVTSHARQEIKRLKELVDTTFGIQSNLDKTLVQGLIKFKHQHRVFAKVFAKAKPKKIFLVDTYSGKGGLIKAAKEAGVETVELQHGTLSRYHLGYSFPGRDKTLDMFPDRFLAWGGYWREALEWPLPPDKIDVTGFPYYHWRKKHVPSKKQKSNQVLVISQGAISKVLSEKIYEDIRSLKEYDIVYKLHPSEYSSWRTNPSMIELSKFDNFRIADVNQDLYALFAESAYQVGVFSTAMIEGLAMGCKTVVLDLPGAEYMERLAQQEALIIAAVDKPLTEALAEADQLMTTHSDEFLFGEDKRLYYQSLLD